MAQYTRADLLARCSALSKARPELTKRINAIYGEWTRTSKAAEDPAEIAAAMRKLDRLDEETTIENVSDIYS